MMISAANCYWVEDLTYVSTEEGWLYLATVIDLFSRSVVGWSMNSNMKADLVNNALLMAIWQRKSRLEDLFGTLIEEVNIVLTAIQSL
jgi:putative transposase